ncbi:MAG: tetratricopeptide repeat protein [Lewinellaceae bacterium]|nr:tetratricopeptide repeat protein [Lewinellaceae bacterium]
MKVYRSDETGHSLEAQRFFGWGFLGQCYSRSGRYEEAIRTLLHTLSLAPHDLYTQNDLADTYRLSGDLDAAREAYLKIIDMNPESPFGYMGMIKLVLAGGKPDEAMIYLEKAVQRGFRLKKSISPNLRDCPDLPN